WAGCADRREHTDPGAMMLRGGPKYTRITREVGLPMGRHHTAQRGLHLDNPDRATDPQLAVEPVVLDKAVAVRAGIDHDIRTEAARIGARGATGRIIANQGSQMSERPGRDQMDGRGIEEAAARQ